VQLVIDDFGKGYSSLSRLAQYPIRCLKIDASFISSLGRDRHATIVELIVKLAQALGLHVTAEGVETAEQRQILLSMGCMRGQGWLFAKAMPVEQVLALPDHLREQPAHTDSPG
jgi:sensor c-di-GMP phosphodiesterase-like protein